MKTVRASAGIEILWVTGLLLIMVGFCPADGMAITAEEAYKLGMEAVSPGEAVSYFDQAIREDPEFGPAYHDRGVAYQKMGEMEKAIRDFGEAIRISDQNVSAYYNRGVCYTITRLYKRAIADYQRVIELAPKDPRAYNNLAWIYAVSKVKKFRNPELAIEHARKAVELTNENHAAYVDTLAESYYAAGDTENAVKWAQKAISLEPGNKTYKDHLERFRKPPEE